MKDYILLMHGDTSEPVAASLWGPYFESLIARGAFQGGSAIGAGETLSKRGTAPNLTKHLTGYIRVEAESLENAKRLVPGNPIFECGGTVEVRELPRD